MIGDIAEYLGWNQMFKDYISIHTFSAKPKICIHSWFQKWKKKAK